MNILIRGLGSMMLMLNAASLFASICPSGNEILDPQALQWTWIDAGSGVEGHYTADLEIGEANLVVGGETITTRVYRIPGTSGTIPGPTITVEPGQKYVLRFSNALPYEAPVQQHNVFKDPNISNLHTHGLHISGETPGDDVTRSFEGGFGGDFVYDIPADHMGGTYWYHAHHHGSTFLQVSGGAFGLLLVDDMHDPVPANVAAMQERQIVIAYLDPAVAGTGGDTLITGTLNPTWTVNGQVTGDLCMPPDTWQHWRVLLADRDARLKSLSVGPSCEVALLSRDGVWRTEAPRMLTDNSINITGASRADLAVRCWGDSEIRVDNELVANVYTDGIADPSGHPFAADGVSTWSIPRPTYLRDLRAEPVDNTETVNMGARTINGNKFDIENPTFALAGDGLQEWTLKGARNHPFHLHIYHVQINGACGDFEDGEYYDVVAQNCDIRFDLDADEPDATVYEGRTIMHCHILEHEDQGAMGWLDVLQPASQKAIGPPTFPSAAYSAYYQVGPGGGNPPADPSNLVAAEVSASQIDLGWDDNSTDETGFDIERSADGANFGFHDSVSANETTYSDTHLAASTTWYYQVRAFNGDGPSGYTNTASATTQSGGDPSSLAVDSVVVTTIDVGKGFKYGSATVVIRDDLGGPVVGATVYGEFSGDISTQGLSADTDTNGTAVFEDPSQTVKGKLNLTFCATSVTHPTLVNYLGPPVCSSL
jgi:FtsP/CotA-like multicopper oxidase with cupredoxin domain